MRARDYLLIVLVAGIGSTVVPANAQQVSRAFDLQTTLGYAAFVDESYLHHFVAGVSVRHYLSRKLAFEPQFLYMRESAADQDFVLLPNLSYDFRDRTRRVIPYAIGGVGVLSHRELTGAGPFTSSHLFWSGGVGVRTFLNDRFYIAPEYRIGMEPMMQFTVHLGYAFGGRSCRQPGQRRAAGR